MASATSNRNSVRFGNANNRVTRYYVTDVTMLGGGGLRRETYRTDEQGNNRILIETETIEDGNREKIRTTNMLDEERLALRPNRSSPLKRALEAQIEQAATEARRNEQDASNGGQTEVGKENAALLSSTANDADNDNDNAESKPSSLIADALNVLGKLNVESASGTRKEYGKNLRYPLDIAESKQDVIKFDVFEYIPQRFDTDGGTAVFASNSARNSKDRKSIGSVILPIPAGIRDDKGVDWGGKPMSPLQIAAADVALNAIVNGPGEGIDAAGEYVNVVKNNPNDAKRAIATYFAGKASGVGGNELMSRTGGMIFNPNMELLFNGPQLRTFSFAFFLSPRSEIEARLVKAIIRTFKQAMSPIRSKSNLFLKTPNTFGLTYLHRGKDGGLHKGLNAFKECAMTGFAVDYTPTGNYATYSDGTPVQYQITMSFSELEPIFNDEYDLSDEYIGF